MNHRNAFTLIELLVVIAIIAILAVVVVLTLNPAQLLAESRDANRVSDMATLQSALNLYTTDQAGGSSFSLGTTTNTYISVYDPQASSTCGSLNLPSLSSGNWACSSSSTYRLATSTGWVGVNFNLISSGSPFGSLPVDPVNQTSTGLFYAYNTNGSQFEVTADLESTKYKQQYGNNPSTSLFPEVISGGTPTVSALYNPSGLVGYWPMNEGTGSSTIDQSGNGDNGTWNGSSTNGSYYSGGKVGSYAGNFNGVNTYAQVANNTYFNGGSFTIAAWVYPTAFNSWTRIIDFNTGPNVNSVFLALSQGTGGVPQLDIQNNASSSSTLGGPSALSLNQWTYITATFNASTMKAVVYYNNGSTSSTVTFSASPINVTRTQDYIGKSPFGGDGYMQGEIDDLRIYSRALSPAEVAALYNAEK